MADNGNGKLNTRQQRAIEALLTEGSVKDAAKAAKVGYRTLRGWLELPAFAHALRDAQSEALSAIVRRLTAGGESAVGALQDAIGSDKVSERIRAADVLLSHMTRIVELHELEQRVAALEQAQGDR